MEQKWCMPAEWAPHEATWLSWPHNPADWPAKMGVIPWVFGEMVRKLAPGEVVRILVNNQAHENKARSILQSSGVELHRVEFFRFKTDRSWVRDYGPIFIRRRGPGAGLVMAHFHFNGWAKFVDWTRDNAVPEKISRKLEIEKIEVLHGDRPFVLEGGAIDVNGMGSLLTTEECLLDQKRQVRNPGLSRKDIEGVLSEALGLSNIIWLGKGIVGDEDTHGHVDDLCRFVGPRTVVLCHEKNVRDANYRLLEENRERLEQARLEDGSRMEIVRLPMPAPLYFDGRRLPASYANFYIANSVVLAPTFNDPADRMALGMIGDLFPDRQVCGIHAVDLVLGLGAIHCLTQQQPA
ncbi:MAG TPA: agmatine deiminase [Verrucomicrobia bacterium]|nr:MAG: agmatine deiminase [Lentisphaerae bacterium GWF2_57_35]HBA84205.1 agmatine deiminase [Verrucomicrobiota bacterium]